MINTKSIVTHNKHSETYNSLGHIGINKNKLDIMQINMISKDKKKRKGYKLLTKRKKITTVKAQIPPRRI